MEQTNTIIAKSKAGTYIDFKGSEYANPCYIKIAGRLGINENIEATYNKKGFFIGKEIRKAINQKWVNGYDCEVEMGYYASPIEILNTITGITRNGSLSDYITIKSPKEVYVIKDKTNNTGEEYISDLRNDHENISEPEMAKHFYSESNAWVYIEYYGWKWAYVDCIDIS